MKSLCGHLLHCLVLCSTACNQKKSECCALVLLILCLIVSPKPLCCFAVLENLMPRDIIMSKLSEILHLLCILPTSQGCCET